LYVQSQGAAGKFITQQLIKKQPEMLKLSKDKLHSKN